MTKLTNDEKMRLSASAGKELTREQIKEWLKKDMDAIYILLAEILRDDACLDALSQVFYVRHQAYRKQLLLKDENPEVAAMSHGNGKEE